MTLSNISSKVTMLALILCWWAILTDRHSLAVVCVILYFIGFITYFFVQRFAHSKPNKRKV